MRPEINLRLRSMEASILILKGEVKMPWWVKGSPEEDEVMVQAIDVLLSGVSDADFVAEVKKRTGRDLREQLTQEQIKKMVEDRKWYSWGSRRN